MLLILPLFLLSSIGIRKLLIRCYNRKKKTFYLYNPVDINGDVEDDEEINYDDGANSVRLAIVKILLTSCIEVRN